VVDTHSVSEGKVQDINHYVIHIFKDNLYFRFIKDCVAFYFNKMVIIGFTIDYMLWGKTPKYLMVM
jgi:hypothetical protein